MSSFHTVRWSVLPILLMGNAGLFGCLPASAPDNHESSTEPLMTTNGLSLINGLSMTNGLSMINGLTMKSGIVQALNASGLSATSSFMNSDTGRSTVAYLVRCALPSNQSITKKDQNGTSYTFPGQIGVAPQWQSGTCDEDCQQQVTACLLAHVNTSGVHIPLWIVGDSPAISWNQNSAYPDQEGSFFGNIFISPPIAYYCNGKDFDVGVVPGRIGAGQTNAPYKNPFASPGYCRDHCTAADIPHQGDGYKACDGYNHIVTVWRNAGTPNGTGGSGSSSSGTGGSSGSGSGSHSGSGSSSGSVRVRVPARAPARTTTDNRLSSQPRFPESPRRAPAIKMRRARRFA
jgi:hypothetical protein